MHAGFGKQEARFGARAAATLAARLTFEAVERRYGSHHALKGLSLDIAPGEVVFVTPGETARPSDC